MNIWTASIKGNIERIQELLNEGRDVNSFDPQYGSTPLMFAAEAKQLETVKFLIQNGADVNAKNLICGKSPLMFSKQIEITRFLLDNKADINCKTSIGTNSLCSVDTKEEFELLLEKGLEIKNKSKNGYTVLMAAAQYRNIEIINICLEKGLNINEENKFGENALTFAMIDNKIDNAKFLIEKGANIFEKYRDSDYKFLSSLSMEKII